ncbi:GatB/YqeY domain-containing protein [Patescibacteria group bacterium]|nr:GatB/YqeY domain-containing protein [Patescibacteria group bacterium]
MPQTLSTLRILCSQIKNEEIEIKSELDDDAVIAILKTQVKQLKDSIVDFKKGERDDLVVDAEKEITVLQEYLPAELPDAEIEAIVDSVVAKLGEGANFGQVMGAVVKEVDGRADGGRVKDAVQKKMQ